MDSEADIIRIISIIKKKLKTYEELQELDRLLSELKPLESAVDGLTMANRMLLLNSFTAEELGENEVLFSKGDPSDCIYVILSGSLQLYNHTLKDKGDMIPGNILGKGTILGERGILKDLPRSLTAVAIEHMYVLRLEAQIFKSLLGKEVNANMETKRKIVDQYIPGLAQIPAQQRERLAYLLDIEYYSRGVIIAKQGSFNEKILIILEGECKIFFQQGQYKRFLSTLEKGSWIGEESALFDKPSAFSVVVTSETLKVARIKNSDIKQVYPSATVQLLRSSYNAREIARNKLATFSHPCLTPRPSLPSSPRNFPLATPQAKEKMNTIINRMPHIRSSTLTKELMKCNLKGDIESQAETRAFRIRKSFARCRSQGLNS
ncbi:unnamed protein product [Blepharisma stoltei]|uniref:Cyclic nucleotide-binding domain-containing protein n=1 Tax=Blepharisma stoltei TaxID=1481888 RepID=A0AAU9KD53_9CILI|nr:unnamed protein product [Blepharisma stoltei]